MPENNQQAQFILRPMTLADLDQVIAIDRASFPSPWPRDAYLHELKRGRKSVCWVVEQAAAGGQRQILASIVIWLAANKAHIGTLAVKPGYRGQKIAQKLLALTLLECHQRGARQVLLEVRQSNQAAQNLYRKFGFEAMGLRKDYYKDTREDAVLMTLEVLNQENLAQLAQGG
ncbi:MAG: ribosomal protein S18-alanine N-acetyltransferase [Chloroflexota bacterium]|nr:ribosomal protein S18-alanine N-acetyltransferase [Chloroflexota bacterium]